MHRDGRTDTVYPDFVRGLWVDQYSRSTQSHPQLIDVDERDGHYSNTIHYTYSVQPLYTYVWNEIFTSQWVDTSMANPSESILHRVTLFITS